MSRKKWSIDNWDDSFEERYHRFENGDKNYAQEQKSNLGFAIFSVIVSCGVIAAICYGLYAAICRMAS